MAEALPARAHVITGGFPPGTPGGHDEDYARLRLLEMLADQEIQASVGNDFSDVVRWIPVSRLLVTYVAGPYPDAMQTDAIRSWIEDGGRWLGLHGTAGGRAVRVNPAERQRRMVKAEHHQLLGSFFLSHPPIRRFRVDVGDAPDVLTKGLPQAFDVVDEPYMIEIQDPASTRVLLTAELGPDTSPPGFGFAYDEDTALMEDGKTRVLGYTRAIGKGGVTYIALGHCHSAASGGERRADPSLSSDAKTPATMRDSWLTPAFQALLRNSITWGMTG
jgi:type 1 glutamine amidotransferase